MATSSWTLADSLRQHLLRARGIPVEYDTRRYCAAVAAIETDDVRGLTSEALHARAQALRERARLDEPLDRLLPEVFAVAREAASRLIGLRPFDVQIAAGLALHEGKVAQLATGEGKTLVAVLPATLNALPGRGAHIFTANDYLARRDAEWMGPIYRFFGLEVGFVLQGMSHDERRRAYAADVTYVTAKEAGFDFLRDHTVDEESLLVQRPYNYLIVDEADFILIDEARVPLVIAGPSPMPDVDHARLAQVVRELRPGTDYDADEYARTVVLTEAGFRHAGELLGGVRLDAAGHHLLLSALHVALHAHALLRRDRDYIVRGGRVELVDEWTGRVAENRRWPHGIQPAVEAKEGVPVRPEGKVLGSIAIQHFVRLYSKIAGMTATAVPAAEELERFFDLATVVFPPHRPCRRRDEPDVVFTHRDAKLTALQDEIARVHATGRPILVGTASVGESEALAAAVGRCGVKCHVLNARHDAREALIVAQAGAAGAVTISTNMAGRGVDIVLGGIEGGAKEVREVRNESGKFEEDRRGPGFSEGPEKQRAHDHVAALGGLLVIGTNRHESRRIDDQLRGRAGRQGDPGSTRFFISLEDDLIERYGVMKLIPAAHRPKRRAEPIDDAIVRHEIARAQRIIEGQNFEIRKTLWAYSQLIEDQRRIVHDWRDRLLRGEDTREVCEVGAGRHYRELVAVVGADAVRDAERRLTLHVLDLAWSDHLAFVEDVREGIHLQRYGGRDPLVEFHRQIIDAFAEMMERIPRDTIAAFRRVRAVDGRLDFEHTGVRGPSSTWTYLVNDDPFSTLGISLMASRSLQATVGFLGAIYFPITIATGIGVWLRRKRTRTTDAP